MKECEHDQEVKLLFGSGDESWQWCTVCGALKLDEKWINPKKLQFYPSYFTISEQEWDEKYPDEIQEFYRGSMDLARKLGIIKL